MGSALSTSCIVKCGNLGMASLTTPVADGRFCGRSQFRCSDLTDGSPSMSSNSNIVPHAEVDRAVRLSAILACTPRSTPYIAARARRSRLARAGNAAIAVVIEAAT